jgi:Escherichia/Staphylococcus phage prohead protease
MATRSSQTRQDHPEIPVEQRAETYRAVALSALDLREDVGEDEPHFRGWLCRTDVRDAYGTTFAPGCWAAGGLDGEPYALCFMHDPWIPVGAFTANDRSEGLWIEGRWDNTRDGRDARTKARTSAPGLSVGFRSVIFDEDDPERIIAARLVEGSQITARMAAVPGAKFEEARSTDADTAAHHDHPDSASGLSVVNLSATRRSLVVARARLRSTPLITR